MGLGHSSPRISKPSWTQMREDSNLDLLIVTLRSLWGRAPRRLLISDSKAQSQCWEICPLALYWKGECVDHEGFAQKLTWIPSFLMEMDSHTQPALQVLKLCVQENPLVFVNLPNTCKVSFDYIYIFEYIQIYLNISHYIRIYKYIWMYLVYKYIFEYIYII